MPPSFCVREDSCNWEFRIEWMFWIIFFAHTLRYRYSILEIDFPSCCCETSKIHCEIKMYNDLFFWVFSITVRFWNISLVQYKYLFHLSIKPLQKFWHFNFNRLCRKKHCFYLVTENPPVLTQFQTNSVRLAHFRQWLQYY